MIYAATAATAALAVYLIFPDPLPDRRSVAVAQGYLSHGRRLWSSTPTKARQSRDREVSRVVEFTLALAAELRAGQPPGTAWDRLWSASPLSDDDSAALDPVATLRLAAAGSGRAGLSRVAACWQVAEHSGTGLADALDRVARSLQEEREVSSEIEGQLAGSRATARLLAVLPVLALVMGEALGADPLHVLLTNPVGWACLLVGGTLSLAGARWIAHQVRSVSPWIDP